jgi:hypothetical protein
MHVATSSSMKTNLFCRKRWCSSISADFQQEHTTPTQTAIFARVEAPIKAHLASRCPPLLTSFAPCNLFLTPDPLMPQFLSDESARKKTMKIRLINTVISGVLEGPLQVREIRSSLELKIVKQPRTQTSNADRKTTHFQSVHF